MDTNGWLAHGEALRMCNENEWIVREAFLAYDRGDFARMMDFVDPGLRWTYLAPGLVDPPPQVCRGREELERLKHEWNTFASAMAKLLANEEER